MPAKFQAPANVAYAGPRMILRRHPPACSARLLFARIYLFSAAACWRRGNAKRQRTQEQASGSLQPC